jgi:hypothetical protein
MDRVADVGWVVKLRKYMEGCTLVTKGEFSPQTRGDTEDGGDVHPQLPKAGNYGPPAKQAGLAGLPTLLFWESASNRHARRKKRVFNRVEASLASTS